MHIKIIESHAQSQTDTTTERAVADEAKARLLQGAVSCLTIFLPDGVRDGEVTAWKAVPPLAALLALTRPLEVAWWPKAELCGPAAPSSGFSPGPTKPPAITMVSAGCGPGGLAWDAGGCDCTAGASCSWGPAQPRQG